MFGINLNSVIPLRSAASEQAEMLTQLLFGETFEIIEKADNWYFVQNRSDNYRGWLDGKTATILSEKELSDLEKSAAVGVINKPVAHCFISPQNENCILTGGSILYNYNADEECAAINGKQYYVAKEFVNVCPSVATKDELLAVAFLYRNAPYLWGGKNALGIDCSGFVQVVFKICGISLPRDCSQQVECGKDVGFLQDAQAGDVAFFENKAGNLSHVGILLGNTHIIHASGRVKTEAIDTEGIISETDGNYTHKLRIIKRIL